MIIFINGSINSGKSTVAKILAERLPNTAILEIDSLREMIGWLPLDKAIPINLENAVLIIKNFSKRNINVIVPYPLSKSNYEYMVDELETVNVDIYCFTLSPALGEILKNRDGRVLNKWEEERIKYHYSVGINNPSFGVVIDNTHQTPEKTMMEILKNIKL